MSIGQPEHIGEGQKQALSSVFGQTQEAAEEW